MLLFFIEKDSNKYNFDNDKFKFSYLYLNFCKDEHINSDKSIKLIDRNYYKVWHEYCDTESNPECIFRIISTDINIKKFLKNEVINYCAYASNHENGKTL